MYRAIVQLIFALLFSTTFVYGDETALVEELWTKWKAGDDNALSQLVELGPEAKILAVRILRPEKEVKWPGPLEAWLLSAMQADAVPYVEAALKRTLPASERRRFIELLESLGRMARPGDTLLKIAVEESDQREAALRALASAQIKKDYLIPEAIRLLSISGTRDESFPIEGPSRYAALGAELLALCPDAAGRDPLFRAALYHPSAQVRERAISALRRAPRQDKKVAKVFLYFLDDRESTGGSGYGPSTPSTEALQAILDFPELPSGVAVKLIQKLYRRSFEGDYYFSTANLCEAICRCGTLDKEAGQLVTRKLRPLLSDDAYFHEWADPKEMRVAVASIVLLWNPKDQAAAKFLADVINEDLLLHGVHAAQGFERLGPAGKEWLPLLRSVLDREVKKNSHSLLAFATAWAIAHIDENDEACLVVLRDTGRAFQDWRQLPWLEIQRVLGKRATHLVDIESALVKLQNPKELGDYDERLWMFLQPHHAAVAPVLTKHLDSNELRLQRTAAKALARFPDSSGVIVPALIKLLSDRHATVRAAAADALAEFKTLAAPAIPALEQATHDDYLTVRLAAEDALISARPASAK